MIGDWVGVGGIAIAALTIWLSFRERRKTYRERLYDRQLDAAAAVFDAITEYQRTLLMGLANEAINKVLVSKGQPETSDRWKPADKQLQSVGLAGRRGELYLPERSLAALTAYTTAASKVRGLQYPAIAVAPELIAKLPGPDTSKEAQSQLDAAYRALIQALRHDLGVERLSAESLRLFGKADSAETAQVQEAASQLTDDK
jgi:hypothetical protein